MEYNVKVPAEGDYQYWMNYSALNEPFGNKTMDHRTALTVDGGPQVLTGAKAGT